MLNLRDWFAERFFAAEVRQIEKAMYEVKQRSRILDGRAEEIWERSVKQSEEWKARKAELAAREARLAQHEAQPAPEALQKPNVPAPAPVAILAPTSEEKPPEQPTQALIVQAQPQPSKDERILAELAELEAESSPITTNYIVKRGFFPNQNAAASWLRKHEFVKPEIGEKVRLADGTEARRWVRKAAVPVVQAGENSPPSAEIGGTSGEESQPDEQNDAEDEPKI